jgi:hypothetical protein
VITPAPHVSQVVVNARKIVPSRNSNSTDKVLPKAISAQPLRPPRPPSPSSPTSAPFSPSPLFLWSALGITIAPPRCTNSPAAVLVDDSYSNSSPPFSPLLHHLDMAISTINSPWTTYSSTGGITTFVLIILPLTVFGYVFSGLASLFLRQARSPLRHLRGPPAPSLILGNLTEMHEGENAGLLQRWEDEYGPALVYRGFVGGRRLLTTDPRAVAHILGNAYDYPKPDFIRDSLATMAAGTEGLLVVEGEQHRRLVRSLGSSERNVRLILGDRGGYLRLHLRLPI